MAMQGQSGNPERTEFTRKGLEYSIYYEWIPNENGNPGIITILEVIDASTTLPLPEGLEREKVSRAALRFLRKNYDRDAARQVRAGIR
jgi:hypothetical protein